MLKQGICLAVLAAACLPLCNLSAGETTMDGPVLFFEDFGKGMDNWWAEGGEKVWIEDGRLHVKADPPKGTPSHVCTVWCRKEFPGDVRIEFDCQVIESLGDANNINFFLCYSDPSGKPLYETRETRSDGAYNKYHELNGYIFTFLNDARNEGGRHPDGSSKARFRMRRCPGFRLMTETFDSHCARGVTYHVVITKKGGDLTFAVDGKVYLQGHDDSPLTGGLIGLRTFQTYLWWDNIRIIRE